MIGPEFTTEVRPGEQGTLIVVTGELDLATAPGLRETAIEVETPVVLDLRGVSFIDSVGLRSLLQIREAVSPENLDIVASDDGPVLRLLTLTKLTDTFTVHSEIP